MIIALLIFFISFTVQANTAEYFGASASTMAIGNQSNFTSSDAANGVYNPALLAENESTAFSVNIFAVHTDFKKIEDVVITSPVNSGESSDILGDVDTKYKDQYLTSLHGSFKLFKKINSKINFSLFLPFEKVLESSTGDPYRPEYVMYRSRFKRTVFYTSYAQKLETFSFSVGGISGIQSNGETYVVAKDSGSPTPSSGKLQFNARPSMALVLSLYKKFSKFEGYFTFQDEVKSKIKNTATGYTPVGGSSLKYNLGLESLLFYDPRIYRVGTKFKHLLMSLEYQDWSGYKAPILDMKNNGGVLVSSETVQNFKTRNILIPKIGLTLSDFSFGLSYRQSPLELKSGASGNSLDTNSMIFSLGHNKKIEFFEQNFTFTTAFQFQKLEDKTITKSPNRENGDNSGQKIGGPSYKAGGEVYALSFGVNWIL